MSDLETTGTDRESSQEGAHYRDHLATADTRGNRVWVYPRKPEGRYYTARNILALVLLFIFFSGPFLAIGGRPVFQLNILERKFYIFGTVFWPQDLHLFGLMFIVLVVFIILFTVVFGRLFCGWICPQTVFMELVFRKIEYWIEGNAREQKILNSSPWTINKIFRKSLKLGIFYLISFVVGNTFLGYIVGGDTLLEIITSPIHEHLKGFLAMVIFSLIFFWVFAWFREQVCTLVCPYGRLQGVLLDQNSIVVHYDFMRGEPRRKGKRSQSGPAGDCVDCNQCVEVCPTGIDIRNGTQLECVNCTACMDACDAIMRKTKKPEGLIRYASYNGIKYGTQKIITGKAAGYGVVTALLFSLLFILLTNRMPVEATVLRIPGTMYQETEDGAIRNLYHIKVVNKTHLSQDISLKLVSPKNGRITYFPEMTITPNSMNQAPLFIDMPAGQRRRSIPLEIEILGNGEKIETIRSSFIGP